MKIKELFDKFSKWLTEEVSQKRLDNKEDGYTWLADTIEYKEELELKKFQEFFDRKEQNQEYKTRVEEKNLSSKKAYAHLQQEINMIYSFQKCFIVRNQTRLQAYRNDLAMKKQRSLACMNIALGTFEHFKKTLENLE